MNKMLRLLLAGLLYAPTLWGQGTLNVQIEVNEIGYAWSPYTAYFTYSAMASEGMGLGGEPLPVIQANLADYDYIAFTLLAPEGKRFRWDPSDVEGGGL